MLYQVDGIKCKIVQNKFGSYIYYTVLRSNESKES